MSILTMDRRAFALGATVALIAAPLELRRAVGAPYRLLTCTAFTDRKTIGYNDQFELTALIEWIDGDGRIFLPLTWGYRGFQVSIASATAVLTNPPINDFHPPPPQAVNDPTWFVHMSKGMVIGEKITPRAREFFPGRGRFTVFVGYLSPVPRAFTSIPKAVTTEDGTFAAPPISVMVT